MTDLGVGTRVYVCWTDSTNDPALCCRTGTVIAGPFPPGSVINSNGAPFVVDQRSWRVSMDPDGRRVRAAEYLLTPIDDDTERTEKREEVEVEATA